MLIVLNGTKARSTIFDGTSTVQFEVLFWYRDTTTCIAVLPHGKADSGSHFMIHDQRDPSARKWSQTLNRYISGTVTYRPINMVHFTY